MSSKSEKTVTYAIITDIHGNIFALEKALEIIESNADVDRIICLGDNFSLGSAPEEVLNKLKELDNAVFIRGNHDRYLVEKIWEYERPTIEGMDPDDPVCIDIVANEKWTAEQLGSDGADFIRKMRMCYFEIIHGTYIEFTHAWFGRDDAPPTLAEVKKWRDHAKTKHEGTGRFVFVHGHIHIPRNEQFGNLKVFCPGSTGLPFDENQKGVVAFLSVSEDSIDWDIRRFEYDTEAALKHMEETQPPFYRNLYSTIKYASIRNDLVE